MRRLLVCGSLLATSLALAAAIQLAASDLTRGGNDEGGLHFAVDGVTRAAATPGIGAWTQSSPLPTARSGHALAAWSEHLYLVGGDTGSAALTDVAIAAVAVDGTVGPWSAAPPLPSPRTQSAALAWGGYLYVIGGSDGNAAQSGVSVAAIQPDGSLGAWRSTSALGGGRQALTAAISDGRIYALGGSDGNSAHLEAQSAAIRGDGTLGAWVSATSLPMPLTGAAASVAGDRLYLAGGFDGSAVRDEVWSSTIAADGTLGPWLAGAPLPAPQTAHAALAHDGYLFLVGGCATVPCVAPTAGVLVASIGAGGRLGPWTATTPLPSARAGLAAASWSDRLFAAGGADGTGGTLAELAAAPLSSDGTPEAWVSAPSLPTARHSHAAVATGGYLYISGGCAGTADCVPPFLDEVLYAPIASDGTLGAFSPTTPLPSPRRAHASFTAGGNLYVIGGCDAFPCNADLADVAFAPIASDGTLGPWTTTTPLPSGRYGHAAAVYLDQVVVAGGCSDGTASTTPATCVTALDDVEVAPLLATGKLGAWSAGPKLPSPRLGLSLVAGGGLYAVGGTSGGASPNYFADVLFAPVGGDGQLGAWHPTAPLPSARANHAAAVGGGWLYVVGGCSGTPCDNIVADVAQAPLHSGGTVGPWTIAASLPEPLYDLAAAIDDDLLIAAGGCKATDCIDLAADVWSARLRVPSGATGDYVATTPLPISRYGHASLVDHDRFYVIGGAAGIQTVVGDVSFAPIAGDGTLGPWVATAPLATARIYSCSVVWNGRLYALGGNRQPATIAPLDETEVAPIATDGTIGPWQPSTPLPNPLALLGCAAADGRIYVAGGLGADAFAVPDVWISTVQPDGALGAWVSGMPLSSERDQYPLVAYDGYLFAVGGASNSAFRDDVEVAPIHADGTLGPWAQTSRFARTRYQNGAFASDGRLYVVGGNVGTVAMNASSGDVQWAPIFPDGSLGEWTETVPYPTPRQVPGVAVDRGFVFVSGGIGAAQTYPDVQVAPLVAPRAEGVYSRVFDIGFETVSIDAITVAGDPAHHGVVRLAYRVARGDGVFGPTVDRGPIALGSSVAVSEPGARYLSLRLTLDDSAAATLGPDAAGARDVGAVTLAYTDHCAAVTCAATDECHPAGTCDPATGACSVRAATDGTACSAGLCEAGACVARRGISGFACALAPPSAPRLPSLFALLVLLLLLRRRPTR